jgi:K+-transporting ATPase ATPase A chain
MRAIDWLQLLLMFGAILLVTKPLGIYFLHILDPSVEGGTILEKVFGPIERSIYGVIGIDYRKDQNWKQYSVAMLVFSCVTMLVTYGLLRLQGYLPLNPQGLPGVPDHLAFNTAASFLTNTNWQSYAGESTMSYFSQTVALVMHHFFSAAAGIAVAAALVRGIAVSRGSTVGNFWRDLVRLNLYLLIPVSIVYALFLVSQGTPDNFRPYSTVNAVDQSSAVSTTQPAVQTIAQGPVASMISIKMFGTNGGGFFNANSSHPFENSNALVDFVQIISFMAGASALTYYLGRMVKNQAHGWAVWAAMFIVLVAGILVCWGAEAHGNPRMAELGISSPTGNMEGKEVRFGVMNSAAFAAMTTSTTCGAVNSMHDSFTPLGGLIPLINMELGEVIFGGVGSGLYGMLVFVFVAIFIAGLMIGRTPEYLGKKIESYDVKLASLMVLVTAFGVLVPTAWASISAWGTAGLNNGGPHGLGEMLYAFSSGTGNNGSAFAGLTCAPSPAAGQLVADRHWDTILGIVILFGRFFMIIPVLALAGSLVKKKATIANVGSFPVTGPTFVFLLIGTVIIVGALTFFPVLSLSPVVEHFLMTGSKITY